MVAGGVLGWHEAMQPLETEAATVVKGCWHPAGING